MELSGTIPLGKSPKGTEMISQVLHGDGRTRSLISPPIRALRPCVVMVQTLPDDLCLSLRAAQHSECSGGHFFPNVSSVPGA